MFLEDTFIYFVAGLTSLTIFVLAIARFGMKAGSLSQAVRAVLQCIGAFIVFFLVWLALASDKYAC